MNLAPVLKLLQHRTGLDPAALGAQTVRAAIAARLRHLEIEDVAAHASRLGADQGEFQALLDEVVIAETWFLRGGDLFEYLAEQARIALRGRGRMGVFRALSVPCSTGEEPYSLALALADLGVPPDRYHIAAVDISPRNIQQARRGLFAELSFRQTPANVRSRHFRTVPGGWEIAPDLRSAVQFSVGNLLDPGFLILERPYDLIFCRNLFIYLHTAARQQGLAVLMRLLAPQGLLCLGHAESLDPENDRFERTGPDGFFLYRQKVRSVSIPSAGQAVSLPGAAAGKLADTLVIGPGPARLRAPAPAPPAIVKPVQETERPAALLAQRRQADGGQLAEALALCHSAHLRFGPSADLYSLMGVIQQARHELSESAQSFRKALYLEADHPEALVHLMLLYQVQGDRDQAAVLRRRLDRLSTRGGGKQ